MSPLTDLTAPRITQVGVSPLSGGGDPPLSSLRDVYISLAARIDEATTALAAQVAALPAGPGVMIDSFSGPIRDGDTLTFDGITLAENELLIELVVAVRAVSETLGEGIEGPALAILGFSELGSFSTVELGVPYSVRTDQIATRFYVTSSYKIRRHSATSQTISPIDEVPGTLTAAVDLKDDWTGEQADPTTSLNIAVSVRATKLTAAPG